MENYIEDAAAIGIIGGTDGPTAIFMTGPGIKLPLKSKLRKHIYQYRRRSAEKKITAASHSLPEVAAYAMERYNAVAADQTNHSLIAQRNILRESLLFRHTDAPPDIPMDFHIYEISLGDGCLEMEIDYHWNIFGISYSGSKKSMKRMKEIAKDLYLYYGVSEEDIRTKSERYHSLLATLSI